MSRISKETEKPINKKYTQEQLENARIGYQKAIDLHMQESDEGWARFNAMLTANSILIAINGTLIGTQNSSILLICILSLIGLSLCVVWAALTVRSLAWNKYFIMAARELEEQYLDGTKVVSKGSQFWRDEPAELTISGTKIKLVMPKLGRFVHTTKLSYFIITLFSMVHVAIIVIGILS